MIVCLGMPKPSCGQYCPGIPIASPLFQTQTTVELSPASKTIVFRTYFKGLLDVSCPPRACQLNYSLSGTLPPSTEISLVPGGGWLTEQCTERSISLPSARDAILVDFDAGSVVQKLGPAIELRIKVPAGDPCGKDLLRLLDGIVQTDIYVPAKMAQQSTLPFPNPCSSTLKWVNASDTYAQCRLLSTSGQVVAKGNAAPGARLELDTRSAPSGIYLLECRRAEQPKAIFKVLLKN